jgi:hypothetical protein
MPGLSGKDKGAGNEGKARAKPVALSPILHPDHYLGFDEASADGGGMGELGVGRVDGMNGVVKTQEVTELVEGNELMAKEVAALMFVQPRNKIRHK